MRGGAALGAGAQRMCRGERSADMCDHLLIAGLLLSKLGEDTLCARQVHCLEEDMRCDYKLQAGCTGVLC